MTHVFVVNERTFDIHLKYMFAGTGYSTNEPELTRKLETKYNKENTLTEMIADISKVRCGDKVIFYVTGCKKFFGVFEVDGEPFFESKTSNYLGEDLEKYLPFRVKIKPYKVYADGISEQIALDDIESIDKPYEMCWSMIYRKLTGMRGCSFLMDYEMLNIEKILLTLNKGLCLKAHNLCYDSNNSKIAISDECYTYCGSTIQSLSINSRLHKVKGSHERHLQAYITQNFDKNPQLISKLMIDSSIKFWIGNEVICSVGEKRIDILTITELDGSIQIRVIELKDEKPSSDIITKQIPWYIKWVDQYIVPNLDNNKKIEIIPTIFAYKFNSRKSKRKQDFYNELRNFNSQTSHMCKNAAVLAIDCIYYDRSEDPIKIY